MSETKQTPTMSLEDLRVFMVHLKERLDYHYSQTGDAPDSALAWEAGQTLSLIPETVKAYSGLVNSLKAIKNDCQRMLDGSDTDPYDLFESIRSAAEEALAKVNSP